MQNRLSLFLASTALAVAVGLPAFAAMRAERPVVALCEAGACASASAFGDPERDASLIRVSDDDRDDDDDDHDDDDDDDDDRRGARRDAPRGPAPAGGVAPPANGLFGGGAPPVAVTR